eukprot:435398_1
MAAPAQPQQNNNNIDRPPAVEFNSTVNNGGSLDDIDESGREFLNLMGFPMNGNNNNSDDEKLAEDQQIQQNDNNNNENEDDNQNENENLHQIRNQNDHNNNENVNEQLLKLIINCLKQQCKPIYANNNDNNNLNYELSIGALNNILSAIGHEINEYNEYILIKDTSNESVYIINQNDTRIIVEEAISIISNYNMKVPNILLELEMDNIYNKDCKNNKNIRTENNENNTSITVMNDNKYRRIKTCINIIVQLDNHHYDRNNKNNSETQLLYKNNSETIKTTQKHKNNIDTEMNISKLLGISAFENWNKDKLCEILNLLVIEFSNNIDRNLYWECNMFKRNNNNNKSA